jgi:hypothetical protein
VCKTARRGAGVAERDPGEEENGGGTRGVPGDNVARCAAVEAGQGARPRRLGIALLCSDQLR